MCDTRSRRKFFPELILFLFFVFIQIQSTELTPVLVFFHGGGFARGGANLYDPDYVMDKNVVLVTVNYRLGVFGRF